MAFPDFKWKTFPPTVDDAHRLNKYAFYRKLLLGQHLEAFTNLCNHLSFEKRQALYIVINFLGVVSKTCADLMFGEMPNITLADSRANEDLKTLMQDNGLLAQCYVAALATSYRGDCIFKMRFGKKNDWDTESRAIVELVPCANFFPILDSIDCSAMNGAIIAWKCQIGTQLYLRREIHLPGTILQELYLMNGPTRIGQQVRLDTVAEFMHLPEKQSTSYPGLLVEYIPNWRLDDSFFGISDYIDLVTLQQALNDRVTKIDKILDKHASPKIILPPGIMKEDPEYPGRYFVNKEDLEAMEVEPEQVGDLPRYLTWDAKLDAAYAEIDRLYQGLMLVSEIAAPALSLNEKDGGQAESGRALRFRMIRTLGKISRKIRWFDTGLKNALYKLQFLNAQFGSATQAPVMPAIEWRDGLPNDPTEFAEVANTRTVVHTMSRRRALVLDGLHDEALEEELAEIQKDIDAENMLTTTTAEAASATEAGTTSTTTANDITSAATSADPAAAGAAQA
jgi:hypothetical protein